MLSFVLPVLLNISYIRFKFIIISTARTLNKNNHSIIE